MNTENSDEGVVDVEVLEEDEQPKSGMWVDSENPFESITEEEMAEGQRLGEVIDTDNDEDAGNG